MVRVPGYLYLSASCPGTPLPAPYLHLGEVSGWQSTNCFPVILERVAWRVLLMAQKYPSDHASDKLQTGTKMLLR